MERIRNTLTGFLLAIPCLMVPLLLLLPPLTGCSSAPPTVGPDAPVEEPKEVRMSGGTFRTEMVSVGAVVPQPHVVPVREEIDFDTAPGEIRLPRQPDLASLPVQMIAVDGVEGLYVPTRDHIRPDNFGLIVYRQDDQLFWMLVRDTRNPRQLGFGTLQLREGLLELVELRRNGNTLEEAGVQQFALVRGINAWTVEPAFFSDGRTAFGDLMERYGTELHWIRISSRDADARDLPTAPLIGAFNPLSRGLTDRPGLGTNTDRTLVIWPDRHWRLEVRDADGVPTVYGGTWEVQGESDSLVLTQTIPPDLSRDDPPSEVFSFVHDSAKHILWLTKIAHDPDGPTAVEPLLPGLANTTVYILRRGNRD